MASYRNASCQCTQSVLVQSDSYRNSQSNNALRILWTVFFEQVAMHMQMQLGAHISIRPNLKVCRTYMSGLQPTGVIQKRKFFKQFPLNQTIVFFSYVTVSVSFLQSGQVILCLDG